MITTTDTDSRFLLCWSYTNITCILARICYQGKILCQYNSVYCYDKSNAFDGIQKVIVPFQTRVFVDYPQNIRISLPNLTFKKVKPRLLTFT